MLYDGSKNGPSKDTGDDPCSLITWKSTWKDVQKTETCAMSPHSGTTEAVLTSQNMPLRVGQYLIMILEIGCMEIT